MVWILKIMAKILEQELWGLCACLCVHMCLYMCYRGMVLPKLIHKRALFDLKEINYFYKYSEIQHNLARINFRVMLYGKYSEQNWYLVSTTNLTNSIANHWTTKPFAICLMIQPHAAIAVDLQQCLREFRVEWGTLCSRESGGTGL